MDAFLAVVTFFVIILMCLSEKLDFKGYITNKRNSKRKSDRQIELEIMAYENPREFESVFGVEIICGKTGTLNKSNIVTAISQIAKIEGWSFYYPVFHVYNEHEVKKNVKKAERKLNIKIAVAAIVFVFWLILVVVSAVDYFKK